MATRYVTVRVVGADGRPKSGKRVWLTDGKLAAFGNLSKEATTNADGAAEFAVDYDGYVEIWVDGSKRISNERIRGDFKIAI
jgi:hypothetical protein